MRKFTSIIATAGIVAAMVAVPALADPGAGSGEPTGTEGQAGTGPRKPCKPRRHHPPQGAQPQGEQPHGQQPPAGPQGAQGQQPPAGEQGSLRPRRPCRPRHRPRPPQGEEPPAGEQGPVS
jgi:hypothetical protein